MQINYILLGVQTENVIEFTMPRTFGSIFSIPVKDIVNVEVNTPTSGAFINKNASFEMQIKFLQRFITGPEKSHTISFNVADNSGSILVQHLQYLKDVETNPQIPASILSCTRPGPFKCDDHLYALVPPLR